MVGAIKMNKKKENHTGIPTQLKERIEQSSGVSLNDVRVNYNSYLPARLDALAYTQGTRVEIGPGQDRHLPHELGHVVQQKLGAVRANAMHPSGIPMNTDAGLEHQADEIGAGKKVAIVQRIGDNVVQRGKRGKKRSGGSGGGRQSAGPSQGGAVRHDPPAGTGADRRATFVPLTGAAADAAAERLGYSKTKYRSHGQPVYKADKGRKYITPDIDGHVGGVWKMADSVENLRSKSTRMGTFDANLNKIGE